MHLKPNYSIFQANLHEERCVYLLSTSTTGTPDDFPGIQSLHYILTFGSLLPDSSGDFINLCLNFTKYI